MTHGLTTNYAKNYCNRTLIVKVIVENVVTCFLGHSGSWLSEQMALILSLLVVEIISNPADETLRHLSKAVAANLSMSISVNYRKSFNRCQGHRHR